MNRQMSYTIGEVLSSDQHVQHQQIALVLKYKSHYMFRLLSVAICREDQYLNTHNGVSVQLVSSKWHSASILLKMECSIRLKLF